MKPTPAQIEAARDLAGRLRRMNIYMDGKWEYPPICSEAADEIGRLTAAAEVGESEWQRGYEAGMKSAEPAIAILKQDVAEMKERCAQVAEEPKDIYGIGSEIAAAIRAQAK